MKQSILDKVLKHGKDLIAAYDLGADVDALQLCRKLHKLELKATRLNTDYCNGNISGDYYDWKVAIVKFEVMYLIKSEFYFNSDPRGYALKIPEQTRQQFISGKNVNIYSDMGGYGILAPEFN